MLDGRTRQALEIIVLIGAWHLLRELCSAFGRKFFKKFDTDYVSVIDCEKMRTNCAALVNIRSELNDVSDHMMGIKAAVRSLVLHSTVLPLEEKHKVLSVMDD